MVLFHSHRKPRSLQELRRGWVLSRVGLASWRANAAAHRSGRRFFDLDLQPIAPASIPCHNVPAAVTDHVGVLKGGADRAESGDDLWLEQVDS